MAFGDRHVSLSSLVLGLDIISHMVWGTMCDIIFGPRTPGTTFRGTNKPVTFLWEGLELEIKWFGLSLMGSYVHWKAVFTQQF